MIRRHPRSNRTDPLFPTRRSSDLRSALGAHHDLVLGLLELGHRDEALALARGKQRRLVDEVGEVRAREARRAARDHPRLDIGRERHRSEEHTSELQSLMRISYAVFCLKKKKTPRKKQNTRY